MVSLLIFKGRLGLSMSFLISGVISGVIIRVVIDRVRLSVLFSLSRYKNVGVVIMGGVVVEMNRVSVRLVLI